MALTGSRSFSRSSTVRAVFFDVGGTLLHLDRTFILACLAERGIQSDATAFLRADRIARRRMTEILRSPEPGTDVTRWRAYTHTMLTDLGCEGGDADAVGTRIRERNREGRLWSYAEPGTRETLATLKAAGYTLGVVSNSDGRVHRFLEEAGLGDELDFVIDSGAVGVEKPDPRIFEIACERAGVQPAEAVHIGDFYEIDVLGARAAGVNAVLIDPHDTMPEADVPRIRALTALPALLGLNQRSPS